MNCLKCGRPLDLSQKICAACGTPVDSDGNGLPDALDKLVEAKVSTLLQGERKQLETEQRVLAVRAALRGGDASHADPARELELCRERLERNLAEPRRLWRMGAGHLGLLVLVSLFVGGVLLTNVVEKIILGRSILAARLCCPSACAGCTGPGRIYSWHRRSTNYEGNYSIQLCNNPQVDIAKLTSMDVATQEDKGLAPYRLTLWTSFLVNAALSLVFLVAFAPFCFAWLRRRGLEGERAFLEVEIRSLEARLSQPDGDSQQSR
jgi:hypothetical protein